MSTQLFWADTALLLGYGTLGTLILHIGWRRYEAEKLRKASWVVFIPAVAAVLDFLENLLLAGVLESVDGKPAYRHESLARWLLASISWTKWLLLVIGGICVVMAVTVWISRRERSRPGQGAGDPPEQATDQSVGICLSGGGIRSAAFCLGVLQRLESNNPDVISQARYLAAVSGGAWAATAWTLQKVVGGGGNSAEVVVERLEERKGESGFPRRKYLFNGPGGILPGILWAMASVAVNLLLIGALSYLMAWPLGRVLAARFVHPDLVTDESIAVPGDQQIPDTSVLHAPAVALLVLGGVVGLVMLFTPEKIAKLWKVAVAILLSALLFETYLVGVPELFRLFKDDALTVSALKTLIGASIVSSIASAMWKIFGQRVSERLATLLPRLLGVALAASVVGWTLLVMYFTAIRSWPTWTWVAAAITVIVLYVFTSPNWPTLHNIFQKRLRRSFDPVLQDRNPTIADSVRDLNLGAVGSALIRRPVRPDVPDAHDGGAAGLPPEPSPGSWKWLAKHSKSETNSDGVPELILCCAQQRNGIATGGLQAESFTISPHWVRLGTSVDKTDPGDQSPGVRVETTTYLDAMDAIGRLGLKGFCGFKGFRGIPEYGHAEKVSWWLATTGAAFSSSMGRMSLGSTNAFLAAVNADLGTWIPNAAMVTKSDPSVLRRVFPRPHFAYLLKEILGWYENDDRFVFVTDGGHWDNLGIVELLRKGCTEVYCVDASGDPPGSFAALRQALALESLELGKLSPDFDLDAQLGDLRATSTGVAKTLVTNIEIPLGGNGNGNVLIHYAKLQNSRDMGVDLRRFALKDAKFPQYSTAQQLLGAEKFSNLVELGKKAGEMLAAAPRRPPDDADEDGHTPDTEGGSSAISIRAAIRRVLCR